MEHNCKTCGKPFEGPVNKVYCSRSCRDKAYTKAHLREIVARVKKFREGKTVTLEHTCPNCGQVFTTTNKRKRFCSESCYKAYKTVYNAEWAAAHPEAKKAAKLKWDEAHRKQNAEYRKAYYHAHREKELASRQAHRRANGIMPRPQRQERQVVASRTCMMCGTRIDHPHGSQKYCSSECALGARRAHQLAYNEERKRMTQRAGRRSFGTTTQINKTSGYMTERQRLQVEEDMQIVYPSVRYKRSLAWTPAMRRYAIKIELELHPVRSPNCTIYN